MNQVRHQPAFAGQIATLFKLKKDDLFLDLTLGDGGHTEEALDAGCHVVSLEVDPEAINRAVNFLSPKVQPIIIQPEMKVPLPAKFHWVVIHSNFKDLTRLQADLRLPQFDAVLADLGTSQYQLSAPERGFSFQLSGPLDMRLDNRLGVTAADLVNALSEKELTALFKLSDELQAKPIARAIVIARAKGRITTTKELADLVAAVKKGRPGKIHPATKTFMALRLAVNLEREALTQGLDSLPKLMKARSIAGIISFHSGEDRLVKHFFSDQEKQGIFRVINVKPVKPETNELLSNPKIRSAKLRLVEKL